MDSAVDIPIRMTEPDLPAPQYAHPNDAGADLRSVEDVILSPGERALVRTGVQLALPVGCAGFVHPRSGLAHEWGLSIVNSPGVIDSGYRGEIAVNLINHDLEKSIVIRRGDRIAQLVIQPVIQATFTPVDVLPQSTRGSDGHGSTGKE